MSEYLSKLKEKRDACAGDLDAARAKDFTPEIDAEVAAFRATLVEKYNKKKDAEIIRQSHRLELLDELVADARAEETASKEATEVEEENTANVVEVNTLSNSVDAGIAEQVTGG